MNQGRVGQEDVMMEGGEQGHLTKSGCSMSRRHSPSPPKAAALARGVVGFGTRKKKEGRLG